MFFVRPARPAARILVLFFVAATVVAVPSLDRAEWAVLQELFVATGGKDGAWSNSTGWDEGSFSRAADPCDGRSWFGIYAWRRYGGYRLDVDACSAPGPGAGSRRLQVLSLTPHAAGVWNGNGLTGSLPSALGQLSALQILLVSSNTKLGGSVPSSVGQLSALRLLMLPSNALVGNIPSLQRLTMLESVGLFRNQLQGSIPALSQLTALRQLALFANQLGGTIPAMGGLTALHKLFLFNNELTGTIPPLASLSGLRQLLLHRNRLSGAVPPLPAGMLGGGGRPPANSTAYVVRHWALDNDPSITLFDNRLSCTLPGAGNVASSGLVAVVAFGNRFSAPAPQWVHRATQDATFLFTPRLSHGRLLLYYLVGGAAALGGMALWARAHGRQRIVSGGSSGSGGGGGGGGGGSAVAAAGTAHTREAAAKVQPFLHLLRDCARALAQLSCVGMLGLLPAYATGDEFFECGEPLMHTSLSYLGDAPRSTPAAAIFVCVLVWASAASCTVLWQAHAARPAQKRVAAGSGGSSGGGTAIVAAHAVVGAAVAPSNTQAALGVAAWLLVTVLLSFPTVLYVVVLYLPTNNTLGIGRGGALALRGGVPFLLALVNAVVLPVLTRAVVGGCLRRGAAGGRGDEVAARLLVLARLLTTIVIPVGAVLVLGEGCGEGWKLLWTPCHGNTSITYDTQTGCHPPRSAACDYYIPGRVGGDSRDQPELSVERLCSTAIGGGYASERCARGAMEALAPLFAEKLAIAALLQPALLLAFFESGAARWVGRVVYGRPDGQFKVGLDLEFAAALAQMEMALFYGLALPVILPIAALSLTTHWLAFRWLLRERGLGTLAGAAPPVAYLRVSLLLQAALATWFFAAAQGAAYGWAVGVVVFTGADGVWRARRGRCARGAKGRWVGTGVNAALVSNARGLRLTELPRVNLAAPVGGMDVHSHYALMVE
eukprot:g3592.t1